MSTESEATKSLQRHVYFVESQIDCQMREIILYSYKEDIKKTKVLEADGSKVCFTASYTSKENVRAVQMNRTIKNEIRKIVVHSGASRICG